METSAKLIMEKYERSRLLEVYFARLNGRAMNDSLSDDEDLYQIDLTFMKAYLLGQSSQDNNLFRLMS